MNSFSVNDNKGFAITFPNGVTLSTQIGRGNYCDNYNKENDKYQTVCCNCEIAIWDSSGAWITRQMFNDLNIDDTNDDVLGRVEINQWLEIFDWCKNWEQV